MNPGLSTSRTRRSSTHQVIPQLVLERELRPKRKAMAGSDDEHEEEAKGSTKGKSRRELPPGAVATLKAWLLSPEHFTHPYPTPQDQVMLMQKTGIDKKQLKNWFTNARRRIWKPMLKKQLEQGKLTTTGAAGGVAVPGVVPGLMVPTLPGAPAAQTPTTDLTTSATQPENPHSVQAMHTHYQQAVQQQNQAHQAPQQYDQYGNPLYVQSTTPAPAPTTTFSNHPGQPVYTTAQYTPMPSSTTTAAPVGSAPGTTMSKNDSHAVLMELFARDQDLVRQATESAKMKQQQTQQQPGGKIDPATSAPAATAQHPIRLASSSRLVNVPTLNSWPHFSSITSLNNLGSMTGVKSITSMSGADLASQGNLNKMGNLAQVKSMESMGKNDSYAFLEVFFGDRSSKTNLAGMTEQRGVKRERDDDNDVGLSLDDEGPSTGSSKGMGSSVSPGAPSSVAPVPAPLPGPTDPKDDTGTLKRAYDDALAARGLISVSRSSEKLTDLALPAKMRKTLSQQFLLLHQQQAAQQQQQQQQAAQQQQQQQNNQFHQYSVAAPAPVQPDTKPPPIAPTASTQQYPGQHPQQQVQVISNSMSSAPPAPSMIDPSTNSSVEVPSQTKCALCGATGVDTQLRPCGHMFHERCLKPSLQTPMGQPKCPIDHIPMQSALLAVPTEDTAKQQQQGTASAPIATSTGAPSPWPPAAINPTQPSPAPAFGVSTGEGQNPSSAV